MALHTSVAREALARINTNLPFARHFGFALWVAWFGVAYNQAAWLTPTESGGMAVTEMFLVSTAAHVAALLACALRYRAARETLASELTRPRFVIACALLATLGCVGIILAGPLYLHAHALFVAGSVLTGLGTAVLCMNAGLLLCAERPAATLRVVLACEMLACLVSFMVSDLPYALATGMFVCLPLLAGVCFALGEPGRAQADAAERGRLAPTPELARLLVTTFVLCLTARVAQGFFTPGKTPDQLGTEGSVTSFVTLACLTVAMLALGAARRAPSFATMFYPPAVVILFALLACVLFPGGASAGVVLSGAAFQLFDAAMWCACVTLVNQSKVSAVLLVACVRVSVSLGVTAGVGLGNLLVGPAAQGELFAGVVFCLLLANLATLALALPPNRVLNLLMPIPDEDASAPAPSPATEAPEALVEGAPAEPSAEHSAPEEEPPSQDSAPEPEAAPARPEAPGRWKALCLQLADEVALTDREKEVFVLLAKGRGSQSISDALTISLYTTRAHTRNIYAKLGVHSRHELSERVERYVSEREGA